MNRIATWSSKLIIYVQFQKKTRFFTFQPPSNSYGTISQRFQKKQNEQNCDLELQTDLRFSTLRGGEGGLSITF